MNTWIITGSSKGIGKAIAQKLLNQGDKVIGISRTKGEIEHENFTHISFDMKEIHKLSCLELEKYSPDGVIFSQGFGIFKNLEEMSIDVILEMMNVNLISIAIMSKLLLPVLKKKPKAFMIFLGSEAGLQGKTRSSIYSMTKFGLRGFVQSIRKECATSNVKVTLIQPGMTRTSFYDDLYFEPKKDDKCAIDPEDIAAIIPLIASANTGSCFDEIVINPQAHAVQFKN